MGLFDISDEDEKEVVGAVGRKAGVTEKDN